MDPLPTRRVGGLNATAWVEPCPGAGREACCGDSASPGWERRCQSPPGAPGRQPALRLLAPPRAPRPTARMRREPLGPCSRGAPHPRRPHRFGVSAVGFGRLRGRGVRSPWTCGRPAGQRSERVLRSSSSRRSASRSSDSAALDAWDHGCGVRRLRPGLEPGHLFGGRGLPAFELGARPGGGLQSLPFGLLHGCGSGATVPIPSSTACASGSAPGAGASSWGPVIAHEKRSPPTSTAINTTPAFVTMPPGERAFRAADTHCFQRLILSRFPWREPPSWPACRRSAATRRPVRGGRCRGRPHVRS